VSHGDEEQEEGPEGDNPAKAIPEGRQTGHLWPDFCTDDRKEATDHALQAINRTITNHTDISHPPFILAHITATNNLTFTTVPQHLGVSYAPYLTIFEDALYDFPITSSRSSQR